MAALLVAAGFAGTAAAQNEGINILPAGLATLEAAPGLATGAAPPEATTPVPSRADLLQQIGTQAGGQPGAAVGSSCSYESTLGVSGSHVGGAVGPTKAVLVSKIGLVVIDKAHLGSCGTPPPAVVPFSTVFATASSPPAVGTVMSPSVVFDTHENRFYVFAMTNGGTLFGAVSNDADATGWTARNFSAPGSSDAYFPIGFSADRIFLWIEGPTNFVATFRKDLIFATSFVTPRGGALTRVLDSGDPVMLLSDPANDRIRRFRFNASSGWQEFAAVAVDAFAAPGPVTQPNGQSLNTTAGGISGPSIQIGTSLWNAYAVDAGGGRVLTRVVKLSTDPAVTTPLFSFTPVVTGSESVFNASVATASETAGDKLFVTASATVSGPVSVIAQVVLNGPNDDDAGWSWDAITGSGSSYSFKADGTTSCTMAGGCTWGPTSNTVIDPSDPAIAWSFSQLTTGDRDSDWAMTAWPVTGTGAANPPFAPIATAATGIGQTGFTANWTVSPAALGYRLEIATDVQFTSHQVRNVGNTLSFPVTGLQPATQYYYRVVAVGTLPSLASNTIAVTTAAAPPATPPPPGTVPNPSCTLTATPAEVDNGDMAVLSWISDDATSGAIDGHGVLEPVAGGAIRVTVFDTTTYTATFTGPGGATECTAAVVVRSPRNLGAWEPWGLIGFGMLALGGLSTRRRR